MIKETISFWSIFIILIALFHLLGMYSSLSPFMALGAAINFAILYERNK